MRRINSRTLVAFVLAAAAVPVCAQTAPAPARAIPRVEESEPPPQFSYTAEYEIKHESRRSNGDVVTEEFKLVTAADSQRRRMLALTPRSESGRQSTEITVADPLNQQSTFWSIPGAQATTQEVPDFQTRQKNCLDQAKSKPVVPPSHNVSKSETVNLGEDVILGLSVRGSRTTKLISIDADGNTKRLPYTREVWLSVSPSPVIVRVVVEDPVEGKITRELVRLDPNEPYPTLFQPPADYPVTKRPASEAPCSGLPQFEHPPSAFVLSVF
jgi:hypothetical protein